MKNCLTKTNINVPVFDNTNNSTIVDVIGNKTDTAVYYPGTTTTLSSYVKGIIEKATKLENHHHNSVLTYDNVGGIATLNTPVKFLVEGGDNVFGKELHVHAGDIFGGGDPAKYFDLNTLYVVSVSEANEVNIFKINGYSSGPDITPCVVTLADDAFTLNGHGLIDNDRVIVTNLAAGTGTDAVTIYHVVGVSGTHFHLSLTQGGAPVDMSNDTTATVQKLTLLGTSTVPISAAAVNSDSFPTEISSIRYPCNTHIGISLKSNTGHTVDVGFLFNLHIYTA